MPFSVDKCGRQVWRNDKGQLHREEGPAIVRPNGIREYWLNDKRHREDGPAYIHPNGYKEYWRNGQDYSEEKYYKALKAIK